MESAPTTTIAELAKILGVSRIAVYKQVKKGAIPAKKIGKTYVITDKTLQQVLGTKVNKSKKLQIDHAVDRVVAEYGSVLEKLSKE